MFAAQPSNCSDNGPGRWFADAGGAHCNDAHFALRGRIFNPVIDTAAAQRLVQFAGAVGGQDDHRPLIGTNSASFGDGNLKVGKKLEQEGLELMIRTVDLVDEQHRLLWPPQTSKHRPFDQKFVAVNVNRAVALALLAERQHLPWKIPLVERRRGVDALVALQAKERAAQHAGDRLGGLGLPDTGRSFEQQWLTQRQSEIGGGRKFIVGEVIGSAQRFFELARTANADDFLTHRHGLNARARRLPHRHAP